MTGVSPSGSSGHAGSRDLEWAGHRPPVSESACRRQYRVYRPCAGPPHRRPGRVPAQAASSLELDAHPPGRLAACPGRRHAGRPAPAPAGPRRAPTRGPDRAGHARRHPRVGAPGVRRPRHVALHVLEALVVAPPTTSVPVDEVARLLGPTLPGAALDARWRPCAPVRSCGTPRSTEPPAASAPRTCVGTWRSSRPYGT